MIIVFTVRWCTLTEPTYEFIKGQGWVLRAEPVLTVCPDRHGVLAKVIKRRPQIGERWIHIGSWFSLSELDLIFQIQRHVSFYNLASWAVWTGSDSLQYQHSKDDVFVVLEYNDQ